MHKLGISRQSLYLSLFDSIALIKTKSWDYHKIGTVAKLPSSKTGKNGAKKQGLKITVSDNIDVDESSEAPSKNSHFENLAILRQSHCGTVAKYLSTKIRKIYSKKQSLKMPYNG